MDWRDPTGAQRLRATDSTEARNGAKKTNFRAALIQGKVSDVEAPHV